MGMWLSRGPPHLPALLEMAAPLHHLPRSLTRDEAPWGQLAGAEHGGDGWGRVGMGVAQTAPGTTSFLLTVSIRFVVLPEMPPGPRDHRQGVAG